MLRPVRAFTAILATMQALVALHSMTSSALVVQYTSDSSLCHSDFSLSRQSHESGNGLAASSRIASESFKMDLSSPSSFSPSFYPESRMGKGGFHEARGRGQLTPLRGGSDKSPGKSKAALGEGALQRLLGKQYTLDMKEPSNAQILIKLIQRHRKGGGEFNAVTLNGKEFHIPGTKGGGENEDADSHFKDLGGGQSTKNQLKDTAALDGLKKVVGVQTDYKGLEYSEAELAKLPKAEAEYRRELMERSKQEIKMEMGFEGAMKGGIDMFKGVMQRFKKEEGAEADFTKKLPSKGILQFRFKEKELKTTSGKAAARAAKPAQQAEWAKGRAQALQRKQKAQAADSPESLSDRINRWFSVQFLLKTAVGLAMRVASVVLNILLAIKNAFLSSRSSEAEVRKKREAAIS